MDTTTGQAKQSAGGVRARVRAELTAEIKRVALDQLRTVGASSLSLRAIARELDMASSAIYRYFPSRDDLLTALIVDAYNRIGELVEAGDAAVERDDFAGRFIAVAHAIRDWAVAQPHEYALVYGSPVPGYAAPEDTIDPAVRVPATLITILYDRFAGEVAGPAGVDDSGDLEGALAGLLAFTDHQLSPAHLATGVASWGEILGLVSLELFGHLKNAVNDPATLFSVAVRATAVRVLETKTRSDGEVLP